ncbi:MAG: DUF1800 family protein, partial [Verrucomicrobiota bacterium]
IDLDGDGMSDIWEKHYSAEALLPLEDTDEDGVSNLQESLHGTNPFDPQSYFRADPPAFENGMLTLRWHAPAGQLYVAETSNDFIGWTAIEAAATPNGGVITVQFDASNGPVYTRIQIPDDSDKDGLSDFEEDLLGYDKENPSSNSTQSDMMRVTTALTSGDNINIGGQNHDTDLPTREEASRFLMLATLGADEAEVDRLALLGYEAWIDDQFDQEYGYMEPEIDARIAADLDTWSQHRRYAWYRQVMTAPDLLRQRIAFALGEIYVISDQVNLSEEGISNYQDMLLRNSFGNWRDLISDVSLHPMMGAYLSHLGNRKADPEANRFPDENYAREIMQLFSIGLFELNLDGTHKMDSNGSSIPTYTNDEIKEFARVFTGFTYGGPENELNNIWDFLYPERDPDAPMQPYLPEHDTEEKRLLNGVVLPSFEDDPDRTVMDDFNDAIDNLFNHPNTGPFISYRLIQRLVTSNPSPGYIQRVSQVFVDNGQGVRGDLRAVIKAILLDAEALAMPGINSETAGRLREPYLRRLRLLRTFNASAANEEFHIADWGAIDDVGQRWMSSPSVFNFFKPDFTPLGELNNRDLVAPEFQILNSTTALSSLNFIMWFTSGAGEEDLDEDRVVVNLDQEFALSNDIEALIDRIDLLLTYGTMSQGTRDALITAYETMPSWYDEYRKVRELLALTAISPDYSVFQ